MQLSLMRQYLPRDMITAWPGPVRLISSRVMASPEMIVLPPRIMVLRPRNSGATRHFVAGVLQVPPSSNASNDFLERTELSQSRYIRLWGSRLAELDSSRLSKKTCKQGTTHYKSNSTFGCPAIEARRIQTTSIQAYSNQGISNGSLFSHHVITT